MLRKTVRLSGMLALVLALALAGVAPAAAQGFSGRNPEGWHAVWNWLTGLLGWGGDAEEGGLTGAWEMSGAGFDPNGNPLPQGSDPGTNGGAGFDPNGLD